MEFSFPKTIRLLKDTGFQGFEPEGIKTVQPKKKPRGKELSEEEKAANRIKSQERVVIEHSIGGIKVWRCMREVCRSPNYERRDSLSWYAAGLHNFRLRLRTNKSYQGHSRLLLCPVMSIGHLRK
jgi:DDE superfamily endonuclease